MGWALFACLCFFLSGLAGGLTGGHLLWYKRPADPRTIAKAMSLAIKELNASRGH